MTVTLCVIAAKSCSTISLWTGSKTARQPGADYWSWRAGYTCCAIPGGAGVGTLVLADDDDVHLSNLQRQILFTTEDIDRPKSQVSQQRLTQLNPDIRLMALQQRLTGETLKMRLHKPMWCSTVLTIWRLARRLMPPAWHSTRRLSPPARSDLAVS